MKQRIYLFGAIALLALIVGAFLLPSTPAQAAAITIYRWSLPAKVLPDSIPTTIATLTFRVNQPERFELATSQNASLGPSDGNLRALRWLDEAVFLDGHSIMMRTVMPAPQGNGMTQIDITIIHRASTGHHILKLVLTSHYDSIYDPPACRNRPCTGLPGTLLSRGSLLLDLMGR